MIIGKHPNILTAGLAALLCFVLAGPGPAQARLLPEEVLVVVNSRSRDSIRLGRFYVRSRGIPASHLAEVTVPERDQIARKEYDERIAVPLRSIIRGLDEKEEKIRCVVILYGIPLRIGALRPPDASEVEIRKHRQDLERNKQELEHLKKETKKSNDPEGLSGKRIKALQREIKSHNAKLDRLLGRDTIASVDSELALLLMPHYPLAGSRPNPHFVGNKKGSQEMQRVLMVSRVDAPTFKLAKSLVRTALEVEKKGLFGKFYLDARGLAPDKNAYGIFDEDIRRTAQIVESGLISVVLDNRPELFGPGDCPSAALYCGWYSLAEYKDAFAWARGAVGYHVASAECRSLRDPKGNYWVKRMIEKGVIATLGPVAEPYLTAFPSPSLFFPLLMTGRYTLAEVFALTNPLLSWRMVLIGDPLYNPFKGMPAYFMADPPPPPE